MKKVITLLVVAIACCSFYSANAQQWDDNKMTGRQFYVELGGPGVLFAANFDSRFIKGESLGFGYRVGMGFSSADVANSNGTYHTQSYITLPLGINYVFGTTISPHAFEVGAGTTILTKKVSVFYYDEPKYGNFIGHFSFMYRYKPLDGGFTWRIGFTPIIGTSGDIVPSAAVGLGYAF